MLGKPLDTIKTDFGSVGTRQSDVVCGKVSGLNKQDMKTCRDMIKK